MKDSVQKSTDFSQKISLICKKINFPSIDQSPISTEWLLSHKSPLEFADPPSWLYFNENEQKVSKLNRLCHAREVLRKGDHVFGRVESVSNRNGILVKLFCTDFPKSVDLTDLPLIGIYNHSIEHITNGDLIKTRFTRDLSSYELPSPFANLLIDLDKPNLTILQSWDELPLYFRNSSKFTNYVDALKNDPAFFNPKCCQNILEIFKQQGGFNFPSSLIPSIDQKLRELEISNTGVQGLRHMQNRQTCDECLKLGMKLFKANNPPNPKGALIAFEFAVRLEPSNVDALIAYGALLANQNRITESIRNLSLAVELDRDNHCASKYLCQVLCASGQAHESRNDYQAAIRSYRRALDCNFPDDDEIKSMIASSARRLENQIDGACMDHTPCLPPYMFNPGPPIPSSPTDSSSQEDILSSSSTSTFSSSTSASSTSQETQKSDTSQALNKNDRKKRTVEVDDEDSDIESFYDYLKSKRGK